MNLEVDLSLNTLIISLVIFIVGLMVKATSWALIEAIKSLVTKLVETVARVEVLDEKLKDILKTIGDVDRLRQDLTNGFKRIKKLEDELEDLKHS